MSVAMPRARSASGRCSRRVGPRMRPRRRTVVRAIAGTTVPRSILASCSSSTARLRQLRRRLGAPTNAATRSRRSISAFCWRSGVRWPRPGPLTAALSSATTAKPRIWLGPRSSIWAKRQQRPAPAAPGRRSGSRSNVGLGGAAGSPGQSAPGAWIGRIVPDDVVPKHVSTSFSPAPPASRGEREQQLVALALASMDAVELTLEVRGPSSDGHELVDQRREDGNEDPA